jgi:hypothetical protein
VSKTCRVSQVLGPGRCAPHLAWQVGPEQAPEQLQVGMLLRGAVLVVVKHAVDEAAAHGAKVAGVAAGAAAATARQGHAQGLGGSGAMARWLLR